MRDTAMMDSPDLAGATPECTKALKLRVYGGRLDGAEQVLPAGEAVRVGHDFDNRLVLRGRGTGGIALSLHRNGEVLRLQVLGGEVILLGCRVGEGSWAVLPLYVPLQLGEYAIAVGECDSPRWAEVAPLVASQAAPLPEAASEDEAADREESGILAERDGMQRWIQSEAEAIGRRLTVRTRPALLIGAAAALATLAAAAPAVNAVRDMTSSPAALDQQLAEAGFGGVEVRRDPTTRSLLVEGRVDDDTAVERIRTMVRGGYGPVTLNLTTLRGAAAAVNGLLQSQGIDAEAVAGPAGIVVHSEYLPQDRLALLRRRIAADLPGTGPVRFVRDHNRGPRDLQYFFASQRFGLASLIDGDPGHIVTADGQYWFEGSLLPTGHRLVSIGHGEIRFERDGLTETLRVAGPSSSQVQTAATANPTHAG